MTKSLVKALLFDKDGTLFDFQATWGAWAHGMIQSLTNGDTEGRERLAQAMHFDLDAQVFYPSSPMIALSNRECAEVIASGLNGAGADVDAIEQLMMDTAAHAPLTPAVPLAPFLDGLVGQGVVLGVMTNDAEVVAHAHLGNAGVTDRFAFIAGSDSGHGAKPDPAPLLAFATATQIDPGQIAMVGDSTHDLVAGRAAGMQTIAVLTGPAGAEELAPYADVVLPNIGHIPEWLARA